MSARSVGGRGGCAVALPTMVSKKHWIQQGALWSFGSSQPSKQAPPRWATILEIMRSLTQVALTCAV